MFRNYRKEINTQRLKYPKTNVPRFGDMVYKKTNSQTLKLQLNCRQNPDLINFEYQ